MISVKAKILQTLVHLLFGVNSLRPGKATQRSCSTLYETMAYCLTTTSHYLNQCWFTSTIIKVVWHSFHGPLTRYVKLRVAHASGMPGTFSPPPRVSDPDVHHGMCVTHMPWCMPGSLTRGFLWSRWRGTNFPGIPGACTTRNFTYLVRGSW